MDDLVTNLSLNTNGSSEYNALRMCEGKYWLTQKLPQICTVVLRNRIGKVV